MLELRRIVIVDGRGSVEQHGQQIPLDIANRRGVGFQAVHDVLDVLAVDLKQPFLDQRSRKAVAGNGDRWARGAKRFNHEIDNLIQLLDI